MLAPGTRFDGFTLLHADRSLVVLDKHSGLLSVPGIGPEKADCLASRAARAFPGARIVHRLDRDTSGAIVLALDADTHRALSVQFQERRTSKRYVAIVAGDPPSDSGEIDLPIRKDLDDPPRQIVDFEHGRPSVTGWRVIRRGRSAQEVIERCDALGATASCTAFDSLPAPAPYARLELEPRTGRGHQLRLHLKSVGLPIVGDDLYAPPELRPHGTRLMLHASHLAFSHPATGQSLAIDSRPPF
ncbi:MAG: RluA family pseudouridine synthase [Phycisphaerae bacterium]|nr:RluA family pseudouridine synthase [Phycisphaerae bacterium]